MLNCWNLSVGCLLASTGPCFSILGSCRQRYTWSPDPTLPDDPVLFPTTNNIFMNPILFEGYYRYMNNTVLPIIGLTTNITDADFQIPWFNPHQKQTLLRHPQQLSSGSTIAREGHSRNLSKPWRLLSWTTTRWSKSPMQSQCGVPLLTRKELDDEIVSPSFFNHIDFREPLWRVFRKSHHQRWWDCWRDWRAQG